MVRTHCTVSEAAAWARVKWIWLPVCWACLLVLAPLCGGGVGCVGGDSGEGTPGPIPNPVAKLLCADGTALVGVWESRTLPTFVWWVGDMDCGLCFPPTFFMPGPGTARLSCGQDVSVVELMSRKAAARRWPMEV